MSIELRAHVEGSGDSSEVMAEVDAILDSDWVQVAIDQEARRSGLADARPGHSSSSPATACSTLVLWSSSE